MAGHIIAVVGGKGGVGKSVFAANLMIAYQLESKQRPLLIDLDMNSLGDQSLILGQNPSRGIVELSRLQGPIDPKTLVPFVTQTPGYSFISAPKDAVTARDLDLEGLGKFLKAAPQLYPLTVVDCGNQLDAHAMKVFEFASAIFVVTTADLIVVNQTKKLLSKLQELLFPAEMIQIVLNRYQQSSIVSPQLIQKNLGKTLFAAIPDEPQTCDSALAKSVPVVMAAPGSAVARSFHEMVRRMQQINLLDQLARLKKPTGVAAKLQSKTAELVAIQGGAGQQQGPGQRSLSAPMDAWTAMKLRIHRALVETMDLKKLNTDQTDKKQQAILREKTQKAILDILQGEDTAALCPTREIKSQLVKEVLDEALGLGPLEDLLADDSVTEIMVNARDQIYIESPYVDARLQDGSRVHVIIPPLALRGPTITIRKFPKKRITTKDLIEFGSMTDEIADFLRACVEAKLNIVVSGGTGSGKTTLLNVLSNFIPASERIITVEDSAELQLGQEHVVRLETRPKNIEDEGEVSIRDLIKCCLRMRPDRIVVGECRGGEALDMLQAMNTGHAGSLTSLHSNNPRECLQRLETLVMMSGLNLPSRAIKENVASAVNLIIQQSRLSDGSRKITHISEVTGMQGEVISLQDIFVFKQEGMDKKRKIIGRYVPTGFIPKFVEEMEAKGMKISRGLFAAK